MWMHSGILGAAGAGAAPPPAFAYGDIPGQLCRINSLEGSLVSSGSTLTGVTDVSGAGATINVSGSPTYTASDAALGGAPSFTPSPGALITAPGVDVDDIAFLAAVVYMAASTCYLLSSTDGVRASWRQQNNGRLNGPSGFAVVDGGSGVAGRKRALLPYDGSADLMWNGAPFTFSAPGSWSGTPVGTVIGSTTAGAFAPRVAFWMPCSAVPSAPLLAALEAELLEDFG